MSTHTCNRDTRERIGEGIEGGVTPVCTCGWRGRTEYAWNDWQMTNVSDQEQDHLRAAIDAARGNGGDGK